MKPIQNFILGLQFLTRIHLTNKNMPCEQEDFRGAMNYFVVYGFIIGSLQYALYQIVCLSGSQEMGILVATLVGIYLTGGIHLDGLADIFDGFGANANRERTLQIMKDSHIGAFGVVALIIDVIYHVIAFYVLRDYPIAFIIVPMSGKLGICLLCKWGTNIKQGLGALWIENIKGIGIVINIIVAFIGWSILLKSVIGTAILLVIVALTVWVLKKRYTEKLGGLNGDCLGATHQMVEWAVLLGLVFILI